MHASEMLRSAHATLTHNHTLDNIKAWQLAKQNFDLWAEQQGASKTSYSTLNFYRFGNKKGTFLSWLCTGPKWSNYISALKNTAGSLVTSPAEITKLLTDYYTSLYSGKLTDQTLAENLLSKVRLPQLTSAHLEVLNATISVEVFQKTVKYLASSKAPGPDGYTAKLYKLTSDFIPETLKHVFTAMWEGGP